MYQVAACLQSDSPDKIHKVALCMSSPALGKHGRPKKTASQVKPSKNLNTYKMKTENHFAQIDDVDMHILHNALRLVHRFMKTSESSKHLYFVIDIENVVPTYVGIFW